MAASSISPYAPAKLPEALQAFQQAFPAFETTEKLDQLRQTDYARLDRTGQIYLDYTGGGLYAASQLEQHMAMLSEGVFGNPHSKNPTSMAMTELVEQARRYVLAYFNASPDEYVAIFTPNASGALKLVGESYPFQAGGRFLLSFDNHNSVNGIREFARARGAEVTYLPTALPEFRLDAARLREELSRTRPGSLNLFAFPAQSNFTGVQHSLEWIAEAQAQGWDVLVDCAAFAPTNRLDLSVWQPDFVPLSFYKMFGYPTGVGCLLAKKTALRKLQRPWFAGGTITVTSVQGAGWHFLIDGEPGFEDGTVNYLNLPAVEIGLRHLDSIGVEIIHERVTSLTGWLLAQMVALRHSTGAPLAQIYGPTTTEQRGGTITFNLNDPDGRRLDYRRIEALANQAGISLRTGCFCNPGTGELAHNLTRDEMAQVFQSPTAVSFEELFEMARVMSDKYPSAIRVSLGVASNFADVYRFMAFLHGLLNRPATEINALKLEPSPHDTQRDSA
ncbi:MAG: aminotransferase class V-fold PLP-dependent enzyme [Anaerolineae bacterium]